MDYYKQWDNCKKIDKFTFCGDSTAGIRTSFYVSELKILLDAGHQTNMKVQDIFITHTHADHIASLPIIVLQNICDKIKTNIYCPAESVIFLNNMINSFIFCNFHNHSNKTLESIKKYCNINGLHVNDKLQLTLNKKNMIIDIFKSYHTIPTISYGFSEVKKKLKQEYIHLDSKKILDLKNNGILITEDIIIKSFIFCGDTMIDIFNDINIFTFPNIIIECTFFNENDVNQSISKKHLHWNFLKNIVENNSMINFYLIHLSAKHQKNNINLSYMNVTFF